VQHREVMGHESDRFLSYFPKGIRLLKGGTASGFTQVETNFTEIDPRLLWIKGVRDNLVVREVKLSRDRMNSGDVFILDIGPKAWQWNGSTSNVHEKRQAALLLSAIKEERQGRCEVSVIEEDEETEGENGEFCQYLPHVSKGILFNKDIKVRSAEDVDGDDEVERFEPTLLRLGSGTSTRLVQTGRPFAEGHLAEDVVLLLDTGFHIYVWVGSEANQEERSGALLRAHSYLKDNRRPMVLPITRITRKTQSSEFSSFFSEDLAVDKGCACVTM